MKFGNAVLILHKLTFISTKNMYKWRKNDKVYQIEVEILCSQGGSNFI